MVEGKKEDLEEFEKAARGRKSKLSFQRLLPQPRGLTRTKSPQPKPKPKLIAKYGFDNWYDWRVARWGIKWDVEADLYTQDPKSLEYVFDSPWGPPIEGLKEISKRWPKLDFSIDYEEPGMCFQGSARYEAGIEVHSEEHEYKPDPDED